MPNKKLTDADKAQIVWLRREGAKTEDIAKKLQISRKTVSKILNEEGNSQMLAEYDQKLQKSMQEFLESQQGTVQTLIKQILESSGKDIAKARLGEKMKALKVLIEAFPAKQTDGEIPVCFSLLEKEIQVADWREEEHPRDKDGKFTDKGGDKRSSIDRIKRIMEERKRSKTVAQKQNKGYNNIELNKVVWAKFYNKVAEIQHGGAHKKTKSGNIRITIEHEGTYYTILYNGDFENPRILRVTKH